MNACMMHLCSSYLLSVKAGVTASIATESADGEGCAAIGLVTSHTIPPTVCNLLCTVYILVYFVHMPYVHAMHTMHMSIYVYERARLTYGQFERVLGNPSHCRTHSDKEHRAACLLFMRV